ncbi:MAG: hypothetical protein K6G55_06910 [Selenomonadaceae bacterium]|nr:hypothetical protein [Selenomonadaceae bacterium]
MPEDIKNLRVYKKWQENYSEELGDLFHNLVFTSPLISPTNFSRRYFKPLLKKCDISLDFTFHGHSRDVTSAARRQSQNRSGTFRSQLNQSHDGQATFCPTCNGKQSTLCRAFFDDRLRLRWTS